MFLLGVHSPSFRHSSCCCPLLSFYFLIIFSPLYFYRGEMDPWARWTLSSLIISVLIHFNSFLFFHFLQMLYSLPQSTCLECEGTTHWGASLSTATEKKTGSQPFNWYSPLWVKHQALTASTESRALTAGLTRNVMLLSLLRWLGALAWMSLLLSTSDSIPPINIFGV